MEGLCKTPQDALRNAGCDEIHTDIASGAKSQRPGLDKALNYLREGDRLVVWKLDRLGRSIQHLIQLITSLSEKKSALKAYKKVLIQQLAEENSYFICLVPWLKFVKSIILPDLHFTITSIIEDVNQQKIAIRMISI